jgi:nucleoside-diphosphate-sugar epimerase
MNICIIGGTGHIGKFLVEMLVEAGHNVTVVTSGRTPLPVDGAWKSVREVHQKYGVDGWTDTIAQLRAEVVIDILQADSPGLYEAVKDTCEHFIVCGSLWMLGLPHRVPTPDQTQSDYVIGGYDIRYHAMLETKARAAAEGKAFTAIMPPNICGPYKIPLDGKGGRSLEVHKSHQRGELVKLPEPCSTLIGPCDAQDVARGFFCAVQNRTGATNEIFNVGSAYALTSDKFIETYGDIYGVKIPVECVSWQEFASDVVPDPTSNWHFKANMCPDISKICRKIGYQPVYTPEQTMERAVKWMMHEKML